MNREMQVQFYGALAYRLTAAQKDKRISTSQIARRADVQFNTVRSVLEGKHFSFHQVIWIAEQLGVSIDELIWKAMEDIRTTSIQGLRNGDDGIESFF